MLLHMVVFLFLFIPFFLISKGISKRLYDNEVERVFLIISCSLYYKLVCKEWRKLGAFTRESYSLNPLSMWLSLSSLLKYVSTSLSFVVTTKITMWYQWEFCYINTIYLFKQSNLYLKSYSKVLKREWFICGS